jgi:hypothetical protein
MQVNVRAMMFLRNTVTSDRNNIEKIKEFYQEEMEGEKPDLKKIRKEKEM